MARKRKYRKKVIDDNEDSDQDKDINDKLDFIKSCQKRKELLRIGFKKRIISRQDGEFNEETSTSESTMTTDVLYAYVKARSVTNTSETEQMEEFIKRQMMERSGRKNIKDDNNNNKDNLNYENENSKEQLFDVPDNLRTSAVPDVAIPGLMTGITEVQLPIDVHLKNIEETEKAKNKILENSFGRVTDSDNDRFKKNSEKIKRNMFVSSFGKRKKNKNIS